MKLGKVCEGRVDEQKTVLGLSFPLVLENKGLETISETKEWIETYGEEVQQLGAKHGAIVFRNFPMSGAEEFEVFVTSFNTDFKEDFVGGGGPRNRILGPIFTSTETPREFSIPFHHELGYLPYNLTPAALCFFCKLPASKGGQTPVLSSYALAALLQERESELVKRLETRKVRYIRKIALETTGLQRGWKEIFSAQTRAEAEISAKNCGHSKVTWTDTHMIVTSEASNPFLMDHRTNRKVFFNAVVLLHVASHPELAKDAAPWRVVYGDNEEEEIPSNDILTIMKYMEELDTRITYQAGDALYVDNVSAMHARASYEGDRTVWTTMWVNKQK
jgi:alpha-ketoglutarate-dependent taurine dioxygenase